MNRVNAISVPLSKGLSAKISASDAELVLKHRWFATRAAQQSERYYAVAHVNKKTVLMHRLILGARPGQMVDHINGDGLDNRRDNLRIATGSQNNANRRGSRTSTGYKCVRRNGSGYQAYITVNYKYFCLGNFESPELAARAYDRAARKYFGEFAHLNFPEDQHSAQGEPQLIIGRRSK